MAKLPGYRRLLKRDLGPDAPEWISLLLAPLNLFLERVTQALEKRLTFDENVDCRRYTVEVDPTVGITIPLDGRKVNGLIITRVEPHAAFSPIWQVEGDSLRLGPWTGISAGTHSLDFIVF